MCQWIIVRYRRSVLSSLTRPNAMQKIIRINKKCVIASLVLVSFSFIVYTGGLMSAKNVYQKVASALSSSHHQYDNNTGLSETVFSELLALFNETDDSTLVNKDLLRRALGHPYMPVDKALQKFNVTVGKASLNEQLIRSGLGLVHYVTEEGQKIWTENQVQYHPFPFLGPENSSFYTSSFEAFIPFDEQTFFEGEQRLRDPRDKKIILWWQHKVAQAPIHGLNPLRACPDFPCVITSDRQYMNESSVVLVNAQFVNKEKVPNRSADQIFVHYQIEAPVLPDYWFYGDLFQNDPQWNSAFNWTMSYRLDADITTYHGLVRKRLATPVKDYKAILSKKTRLVAWIVSNCNSPSQRGYYVKELQKFIPVDIYGKCGNFSCRRDNDSSCLDDISRNYKFYLGFENSLCKDYITEKLFRYFDSDLIVIARGDNNSYSGILPSETFINTANFKSVEELAKTLLYLNSHDDKYMEMLKEKDKYFTLFEDYPLTLYPPVFLEYRYEAVPMCELCQRAWNIKSYAQVIPDMNVWFRKSEYQCQVPTDLPWQLLTLKS